MLLGIIWYYIKYLFGIISYKVFIEGALDLLVKHNTLFIKLFQFLSANKHDYFRKYTNNSSYSPDDIDMGLLDEIKREYNITFYSNSNTPINTGMIALIFKGHINGVDVAVKIPRKNIRSRLESGFKELQWFYKIINFFYKDYPILSLVANFIEAQDVILDQCSFETEIIAQNTMRRNLAELDHITDKLIVPKIYNHDGESRFVITEFLEGIDCFSVDELDRDQYTKLIVIFAITQLFLTEVFHTDSHPGNLIFMKRDGVPILGIIDFGMHCYISRETRDGVTSILGSISKQYDVTKSYRFLEPFLLPKINFASYSEDIRNKINTISERMMPTITSGSVKEHEIVMYVKELCQLHPDFKKLSLNVETVQLVLAQACLLSTCHFLSDKEYVSKCYDEIIREIIS